MTAPRAITYVTSRWGEPSQTFVRREALAVARRGVAVTAASLKTPGPVSAGIDPLHLGPVGVVAGLLRATRRRPRAVAGTVVRIVRARPPLRNLASHLGAALIGIGWVGSGRLPAGHLHAQFGWVAATAAWAAARLDGRRYSVMLHAFEIHDVRYQDAFTGIPLAEAVQVFVESTSDQRIVADRWSVAPLVVRLGVEAAWLDGGDEDREPDLVVAVGRLVEKKGYGVLLDALATAEVPWRCEIVGDGPLHDELRSQIERLGLGGRVTLAGSLSEAEVHQRLRRAAVMCLASVETPSGDRDGTPMAIVEAMACGATVVSTDAGAIAELVGDAGVVVPQGDVAALAAALDRVADGAVRSDLVARARSRVAAEWTSDAAAGVVVDGVLP